MLFFKTLKDQKLGADGFADIYEKECHICRRTLQIIEVLEADRHLRSDILEKAGMDEAAYLKLLEAEHCEPEMTRKLYHLLGLSPDSDPFQDCPRLKA